MLLERAIGILTVYKLHCSQIEQFFCALKVLVTLILVCFIECYQSLHECPFPRLCGILCKRDKDTTRVGSIHSKTAGQWELATHCLFMMSWCYMAVQAAPGSNRSNLLTLPLVPIIKSPALHWWESTRPNITLGEQSDTKHAASFSLHKYSSLNPVVKWCSLSRLLMYHWLLESQKIWRQRFEHLNR